jgi:hypothetical protein
MSFCSEDIDCPICYKKYPVTEIENHANKCIFLSSGENDAVSTKRASDHKHSSPNVKRQKNAGYGEEDHARYCHNVHNEQPVASAKVQTVYDMKERFYT